MGRLGRGCLVGGKFVAHPIRRKFCHQPLYDDGGRKLGIDLSDSQQSQAKVGRGLGKGRKLGHPAYSTSIRTKHVRPSEVVRASMT